ncbi:AMP-binding protein [Aquabacterium sp.]|uniref:AMP-binding protein n=1 Tax=Aquabacterium sp. TaxID=1872578 RepID=UPI0035AFC566
MTQAAYAPAAVKPSVLNADGTTNRIWLSSYVAGVPAEINLNQYESLNAYFDECISKFRPRVAFVSVGSELTYADLENKVQAFAGWLQSQGVKKGDRVAIMSPNLFQYPVCLFAILRIGAIVVNVNPLYTARELAHQLKDSGAETIIVMENFAKTLQDALPGTAVKRIVLTQLGDLLSDGINLKGRALNFVLRHVQKMVPAYSLPGAIWLRTALKQGAKVAVKPVQVKRDDLAFLQYTGGTTGVAKGAMLTHGNVLANCLQTKAWADNQWSESEIETMLTPLPLYHIYSLTVNCLIFLGVGGRNVLIANPRDTKRVMMIIKNEKFSAVSCVNTLFTSFLDDPEFSKLDFSKLKLAMAGGTALQRSVAERWHKVTGNCIVEGYGLTECSPIVTMNPVDISKPMPVFTGSIGLPPPSTEVRLRSDDGAWVEIGEPGEICVRGPQVMKGYWNRPEETAKVIDAEGWLSTGDVGVMDDKGFFKIVDRKKDMILVSGFNVYPNEIEDVIAMHDEVKEVAVIGVPDAKSGEAVKAIIVPRDPKLTKEAILEHCRANLTGYKMPRHIEFRTTELPKSPVGKILRRELRDSK